MKQKAQIHILPTDKPSRLCLSNNNILTIIKESNYNFSHIKSVNIYITSDEEIKDGDIDKHTCIFISDNGLITTLAGKGYGRVKTIGRYYKIILTTDQDLIADGVQAIDDAFLQWFVHNPSCEGVEIDLVAVNEFGSQITVNSYGFDKFIYKIIIPQEESKQELERGITITHVGKQETLEEAAEKFRSNNPGTMQGGNNTKILNAFKNGAKWQAERMYSEEEVYHILEQSMKDAPIEGLTHHYDGDFRNLKQWFEQFKKK